MRSVYGYVGLSDAEPPKETQRGKWHLSYWPCVLLLIALSEVGVIVQFFRARAAEANATDCLDECIDEWLDMLFWGAAMVLWPLLALFIALIVWTLMLALRRGGDTRTPPAQ